MAQKRFVFDDEKETVQTQQSLSQIDQYENYKHSEEKKIIDKKETISKIPKDSFSPQYSMKETREEPIPTMIHKKTKDVMSGKGGIPCKRTCKLISGKMEMQSRLSLLEPAKCRIEE